MTDSTKYVASDSVAVVRHRRPGDRHRDSIAWIPVFLREPDLEPFVQINGEWIPANGLAGFERFEKVRPLKSRKLFNTATGKLEAVSV